MEKKFLGQYFLSSFSHQIRTPLNGIVGYSQLLAQTQLDRNQMSYMKNINSCCLQLLSLVNDILEFSRLVTGHAHANRGCVSTQEIIQDIRSAMDYKIREKQQKLHFCTEKFPECFISDKQKITQILLNLVSNASKFSPVEGRIIVEFKMEEKNNVYISVEDNGIGISPKEQELIFAPFIQIQETLATSGSGLGLAICKKLAEVLNGNISVQSEKGTGSIFCVTFPYESYEKYQEYVQEHIRKIKGISILVLDSEIDTRLQLGEILFENSLQPVICSSEKEFVRMLSGKRYNFSCIIATVDSELLEKIREIRQEIPIISLSSNSIPGISNYVRKPVNSLKLLEAIMSEVSSESSQVLEISSENVEIYQLNEVIPEEKKNSLEILIVEDNLFNLEMLVRILSEMGFADVDTVNDGEKAIQKIEQKKYDLLLLDLKMPKKNGFEVAEYVRNSGRTEKIAVISASVLEYDRKKCKELGVKFFLLKPFNITTLKNMMKKIIYGTEKDVK